MKLKDLIEMYEDRKKKFGAEAYKHISELLAEAKEVHRRDFLRDPTPQGDHEQYQSLPSLDLRPRHIA